MVIEEEKKKNDDIEEKEKNKNDDMEGKPVVI